MIQVILCDDHALIRRGIRDTLSDAADNQVVGEAADYGELRALMRSLGSADDGKGGPCDVLVLDINLPGRSGLSLLPSRFPWLRSSSRRTPPLRPPASSRRCRSCRRMRAGPPPSSTPRRVAA